MLDQRQAVTCRTMSMAPEASYGLYTFKSCQLEDLRRDPGIVMQAVQRNLAKFVVW